MKKIMNINQFFAFSEKDNKMFFSEFDSGVNIISGKNTSGKSTIFAAILYTFGINDVALQLSEILDAEPIFRVDLTITFGNQKDFIIITRGANTLCVKVNDLPVKIFNGINANNSVEHIKLKEYLNNYFNFHLKLESKGGYKTAPIETMFLPYYISQSTGWIYIRKSFGSLDFYKNFKFDYLDYYLCIDNNFNRIEKQKIENELISIRNNIKFYKEYESNNINIQISKISDEKHISKSKEYIEIYKQNKTNRIDYEKEYLLLSNKLSYYKARKRILDQIRRNVKKQNPKEDICPTCLQKLSYNEEIFYNYLQDTNDTEKEILKLNDLIKKFQGEINSLDTKINKTNSKIETEYEILEKTYDQEVSFTTWIDNKANVKIIDNIDLKIKKYEEAESIQIELLKNYITENEIFNERVKKSKLFKKLFTEYLSELGVKRLNDERFTDLYRLSAFPYQGVELHKTILAYNFAFNKMCLNTENIHRFPFMLDAIFNEDIEYENKRLILNFINKFHPKDTQLFISIADSKNVENIISDYNRKHFDNKAKEICLGAGKVERSFFIDFDIKYESLLDETFEILNTI